MEPTRDTHATLVDLLDRVLDKGLILDADLIIHVAGIPLLGVNLKACLAGMETMLKYGIWRDWDEAQRAVATEEQRRKKGMPLAVGEEVLLKIFASQWYGQGIYHNWRPGHLYITDRRVLLFRKEPVEVLFQCLYEEIKAVATERKANVAGKETEYLYLWLKSGELAQLHLSNALAVKDAIEGMMKTMGLKLEESPRLSLLDEAVREFLSAEEQVIRSGRVSHLVAEPRPGGATADVWKTGRLYVTTQRLIWWHNFDDRVAFEVPLDKITEVELGRRDLGDMLGSKPVLDLVYRNGAGDELASFCAAVEELNKWQETITEFIVGKRSAIGFQRSATC
jgi:hypothetical protein